MLYNDITWRHFNQPQNVGYLDTKLPNVGTAKLGNPHDGSEVICLQIQVADNEHIERAVFKAYGSGYTIAASSWLTDWLIGKTLTEAESLGIESMITTLALPTVKFSSAILLQDALKKAVADYRNKQHETEVTP